MAKKSKYNTFFFVRLGLLLLILVGFAAGIFIDRQVLIPAGMEAVDKIAAADSKSQVHELAGKSPTKTQTAGSLEIETYEFGRILPMLKGPEVSVIYRGDSITEVIKGPLTKEYVASMKN